MGKLDRAIGDAEKNNMASKAGRELKNKVQKETKRAAKKEAKRAAKRAAKRIHNKLLNHSKLYARGTQLAKHGAKLAAQAARSVLSFLATPPIGWICSIILICIIVGMFGGDSDSDAVAKEQADIEERQQFILLDDTCPVIGTTNSGSVDSGEGQADWVTPGTVAYDNAENMFNHWTDKGLSGAAAAGIVGWVASEGGFAMVGRAEGHYGSDITTNSVMYGVVPIPSTANYEVGGGGIYQFTPYTNYAPLSSPDWEDIDKMNAYVGRRIVGGSWNASMDLTGDSNTFSSMAQQTNPQYATLIWQSYERGDVAYISKEQKQSDAQKAYDAFKGSEHNYDDQKFERAFGEGSGGEIAKPAEPIKNKCGKKSGGEWRATGGQPSTKNGAWKPEAVPDDIKEFAIDPTSVGLAYSKRAGWEALASDGDQCTDLSASLMYALWEKDGTHPTQKVGNGINVVKEWVNAFGGTSSTTPTAGAVFSSSGQGSDGHTGVVSQVFDNGDFLIVEQNVSRLSGAENGTPFTWNYRYVKKGKISSDSYSFFDPSTVGFKMVSGIKSL